MPLRLLNTPGNAGGPGGRDRTLAVKSGKNAKKLKLPFFCIYLLVREAFNKKKDFFGINFVF